MKIKRLSVVLFPLLSACGYYMNCIEPRYYIKDKETVESINKENIKDIYNKYEKCPSSCDQIVWDNFDYLLNSSSSEEEAVLLSKELGISRKKDGLDYSFSEWHNNCEFYYIVECYYDGECIDIDNEIYEQDNFQYKTISFYEEKVHLTINGDEYSSIEMTIIDLENVQTILDTFEFTRYCTREDTSLIYSEIEELEDRYIYKFNRIYCVKTGEFEDWQYYLTKNQHTIYKEDGRVSFGSNEGEILVATDGLNLNS